MLDDINELTKALGSFGVIGGTAYIVIKIGLKILDRIAVQVAGSTQIHEAALNHVSFMSTRITALEDEILKANQESKCLREELQSARQEIRKLKNEISELKKDH